MKKNRKRGFILAETLVIATVVMASLVFIYVQFNSVNNGFNRTFKYNSVNNLYLTNEVKKFIINNGTENITQVLNDNSAKYIDLTTCSNSYFTEYVYCQTLFNNIKAKKVLFTTSDVTSLKDDVDSINSISPGFATFIKSINSSNNGSYRIMIEFEDDTYATLQV